MPFFGKLSVMASDLLCRRKEMPLFCPCHICIVLSLIATKLARKKVNVGIHVFSMGVGSLARK